MGKSPLWLRLSLAQMLRRLLWQPRVRTLPPQKTLWIVPWQLSRRILKLQLGLLPLMRRLAAQQLLLHPQQLQALPQQGGTSWRGTSSTDSTSTRTTTPTLSPAVEAAQRREEKTKDESNDDNDDNNDNSSKDW